MNMRICNLNSSNYVSKGIVSRQSLIDFWKRWQSILKLRAKREEAGSNKANLAAVGIKKAKPLGMGIKKSNVTGTEVKKSKPMGTWTKKAPPFPVPVFKGLAYFWQVSSFYSFDRPMQSFLMEANLCGHSVLPHFIFLPRNIYNRSTPIFPLDLILEEEHSPLDLFCFLGWSLRPGHYICYLPIQYTPSTIHPSELISPAYLRLLLLPLSYVGSVCESQMSYSCKDLASKPKFLTTVSTGESILIDTEAK
jgi:hypothetical protein